MRIREARKQKKLSQKELAAKLGIAPNTLSQYETGKREPDIETLKKIAIELNTTADYLIELIEFDKKDPTPVSEGGLNEEEEQFLGALKGLTSVQQEALLSFLRTLLGRAE